MNTVINTVTVDEAATRMLACDAIMRNAVDQNGIRRAYVPMALMELAPYQRVPDSRRIRRIAENWDDRKSGEVTVSYRDNRFYIIDGQHRVRAATLVGKTDIFCIIYSDLTLEQEALMFADQSINTARPTLKARMSAAIIGGEPRATAIKQLCDEYGITVTKHKDDDKPVLGGVRAALNTYNIHGERGLRWCFDVILHSSWHFNTKAYGETMLIALRDIYKKYAERSEEAMEALSAYLIDKDFYLLKSIACARYMNRTTRSAIATLFDEEIQKVF